MNALHGRLLNVWRKSLMATAQECCEQYWTSPGGSIQQSSSCMDTDHSSRKLYKLDEPDMQDTAGEVATSSKVIYSFGPLHMAEQKQDNQLELTYSSSVPIRDVALRTCWKWWTIGRGGKRGSGISVLMTWHDDDVEDFFGYFDSFFFISFFLSFRSLSFFLSFFSIPFFLSFFSIPFFLSFFSIPFFLSFSSFFFLFHIFLSFFLLYFRLFFTSLCLLSFLLVILSFFLLMTDIYIVEINVWLFISVYSSTFLRLHFVHSGNKYTLPNVMMVTFPLQFKLVRLNFHHFSPFSPKSRVECHRKMKLPSISFLETLETMVSFLTKSQSNINITIVIRFRISYSRFWGSDPRGCYLDIKYLNKQTQITLGDIEITKDSTIVSFY